MVSVSFSEAATEVLEILHNTREEDVKKIPNRFINYLEKNSSIEYKPKFDFTKSINELELKPMTKGLLGLIYLKYWSNEEQKKEFIKRITENEKKKQEIIRQKYDVNNLFKNRKKYNKK